MELHHICPFCLAYFTEHNVFQVRPCCGLCPYFLLFKAEYYSIVCVDQGSPTTGPWTGTSHTWPVRNGATEREANGGQVSKTSLELPLELCLCAPTTAPGREKLSSMKPAKKAGDLGWGPRFMSVNEEFDHITCGPYGQRCPEHACSSICLGPCFHFCGVFTQERSCWSRW